MLQIIDKQDNIWHMIICERLAKQYLLLSKELNEDKTGVWRRAAEQEMGKPLTEEDISQILNTTCHENKT